MSDLSELQATLPVKIVGADLTGLETLPISGSINGDLGVSDGLSSGGVYGNLVLTTANTALEAKVGATRLSGRKNLTVMPIDAVIYWGLNSSVTTSTGTPIFKNQFYSFSLDATDSSVAIFLVSTTAGADVRITELP